MGREAAGTRATRRSYDRVAARYRERFADELDGKPFDRAFLDEVGAYVDRAEGWVVDLGCGPGQIGAYLSAKARRVLSVDLSLEMLRVVPDVVPNSIRVQADIRGLPFRAGSLAGVVAFYSLIHIAPADLDDALDGLSRVLAANGALALAVHVAPPDDRVNVAAAGDTHAHVTEMLAEPVDLDVYFYGANEIVAALERAQFEVVRCVEREPYGVDVEGQTTRAYVLATKRQDA